jgi:DNA polymerase-4
VSQTPILHADLDAFFASVEQRDEPSLRDRPMIVGYGVVLACSYEAKARGVRTAMNGAQALRICPEAIVVPPRMEAYSEASRRVYEIFEETSPLVEGLSIDEAFLDVRGLDHISGSPVETARKLRRRVLEEVGLRISVGIARTKFLAKIASGESKPDGLLRIDPSKEEEFLHPLAIESLWGVGRVTSEKLRSMGMKTVGDIARCPESRLVAALGSSSGRRLVELANNRDPRAVAPRARRKSIGAQSAFPRSSRSPREVDALAAGLVDRTARRLRESGQLCATVAVSVRFDDMQRASRSHALAAATSGTVALLEMVRRLLAELRPQIDERGITLLGVTLENLGPDDAVQLELPLSRRDAGPEGGPASEDLGAGDEEALDAAIDDLRNRFGADAIRRASLVDKDGIAAPVLPD